MKGCESGMPEADYWETFFEPSRMLELLIPAKLDGRIVKFGSGYGTFTLTLAKVLRYDKIRTDMVRRCIGFQQSNVSLILSIRINRH